MLYGPFGTTADVLAYLLLLVVTLAVWRLMWRGRPLPGVQRRPTLLVGHRGTRGREPENTLSAFRYALEAGLDGIEFDVRKTLDGVQVIHHERLVDGFPISAQTFQELRQRLPELATLDELLALAGGYPGRLLNLEIKAEGVRTDGLERDVARAVVASGLAGRVLISSFNPLSLLRVRLRAPALRVALLYAKPTLRRGGPVLSGWLHVDAIHPSFELVDHALVRWGHARGMAVNVWTVNDVADMRRLRSLGVDAIMGDDPETLLSSARGG